MDTIKILEDLVNDKKSKQVTPPIVDINEFCNAVVKAARQELNDAYKMGIIKVHNTLNSKAIELVD